MMLVQWILAISPIAVVLFTMVILKWSATRAGVAGWFVAVIVAVMAFGADANILAIAQIKGIILTLYVLYIVWTALLLYFVAAEAGAIDVIGRGLRRLTPNKTLQLLIIGWVFSSFLQGVAGFGVPIAIAAPLLLGLGFPPLVSVAAPAIGHSWSVTFGNMATSFETLLGVTGMPGESLTHWSAILLGICAYLCGAAVIHVYRGMAGIRENLLPLLAIGSVMAITQYLLAEYGVWNLGGFTAGITGLIASIYYARVSRKSEGAAATEDEFTQNGQLSLGWALSSYLVFIVVICSAEFIAPVKALLNQFRFVLEFPAITTTDGLALAASKSKSISLFGHPGAHLLYSAICAWIIYRFKGCYSPGSLKRILGKTAKSGIPTSVGMFTMVCFALIMDQSKMTFELATGISHLFGQAYPLFASAVGVLGAFMTGSTTNSNVVFGLFQMQTAELAALSVPLMLAAQTTGASIGSMLAPAKILVGCSTVGLTGKEAPVLSTLITYGTVITIIKGVIVLTIAQFIIA